MDLPRLMELKEYWVRHPPIHVMLEGFFGIKQAPPKITEEENQQNIDALMRMFGHE